MMKCGLPLRSLIGCLLLLLAVGCMHAPRTRDRRVVVLDFESNPQKAQAHSLAEWLRASLANYPRIAMVESSVVEGYLQSGSHEPNALRDAGRKADVDYIVLGSISQLDRNYIVNARLLATTTGEIVKGSSITRACNREEDLFPLTQAIARVMAGNIKVLAERYDAQAQGQ
jgi:TolB-like protein